MCLPHHGPTASDALRAGIIRSPRFLWMTEWSRMTGWSRMTEVGRGMTGISTQAGERANPGLRVSPDPID